jgi:hypothetical protein
MKAGWSDSRHSWLNFLRTAVIQKVVMSDMMTIHTYTQTKTHMCSITKCLIKISIDVAFRYMKIQRVHKVDSGF